MPLADTTVLLAAIKAALNGPTPPATQSPDEIATKLTAAIAAYVQSAVVTGTATGAMGGGPGVPIVGTLI